MAVLFLNVAMIRVPESLGCGQGGEACDEASSPACAHAHGHGAPVGAQGQGGGASRKAPLEAGPESRSGR